MRKQFLALLVGALVLVLSRRRRGLRRGRRAARTRTEERAAGQPRAPARRRSSASSQKGLQMKLAGKFAAGAKVGKVAKGQYVELAREARTRSSSCSPSSGRAVPGPRFPTYGRTHRVHGPLRNQIPQPDRAVDNSTIWKPDFSKAHFENMYSEPACEVLQGAVLGPLHGQRRRHRLGHRCRSTRPTTGGTTAAASSAPDMAFVRDCVDAWVRRADRRRQDAGRDRGVSRRSSKLGSLRLDGDGNFNEPDGYIDHFQIVHAGGDEAAGDRTRAPTPSGRTAGTRNLQRGGPMGSPASTSAQRGALSSSLGPEQPHGRLDR